MIQVLLSRDDRSDVPVPQEGTLYKVLNLHGQTFPLYYGYYEECERQNPAVEPMPIYPDFQKEPRYTQDGFPFVTKMQDRCMHYQGKDSQFSDCAECHHYLHGEELLGICICPKNRKTNQTHNGG